MNVVSGKDTPAVPDSCLPYAKDLESFASFLESTSLNDYSLDALKLGGPRGGGGGGEVGIMPDYYSQQAYGMGDFASSLDADWLSQTMLLPSPEEQASDMTSFLPPPEASYPAHSPLSSLPTPDSSLPPSPQSCSYPDPDVVSAFSSFLSTDMDPQYSSFPDILPTPQANAAPQFDLPSPLSSPSSCNVSLASYQVTSDGAYLPSPSCTSHDPSPKTPYSFPSFPEVGLPYSPPSAGTTSSGSIRDLLVKTEASKVSCDVSISEAAGPQKRKAVMSAEGGAGTKGKRQKLSRAAKKERKKEQNKLAALRYRQRKKEASDEVEEKRDELEAINHSLHEKVVALTAEISYLKKLWQEIQDRKSGSPSQQLC